MGYKQGEAHSDVMNYKPPQGPTTLHHVGPGLGGHNCGNCGTQEADHHEHDTQGKHLGPGYGHEKGQPGIGGKIAGHGTEHG